MRRLPPKSALGVLVVAAFLARDAADHTHRRPDGSTRGPGQSGEVLGRVVGGDGKPRLDATVALVVDGVPVASTTTGLGGLYSLPAPNSTALAGRLHIQAPGFARYVLPIGPDNPKIQRLLPGHSVSGRIEGSVDGIQIVATPLDAETDAAPSTSMDPYTATISEDGAFSLENLPLGNYSLAVELEGRASPPPIIVSAGDRELRLAMPKGQTLRGTVLSPSGQGVVGANVLVGGAFYWPAREARTGQGGHFSIPGLEPGDIDVWARTDAWAAPVQEGVPFSGEESSPLVIQLSEGGVVKGVVHDRQSGEPIASAKLALAESWPANLAIRTESGASGHFSFGAVSPGSYLINVWAEGFAPLNAHPIELRSDAPLVQGISLSMNRGAEIEVEVLDENLRPVQGAFASVTVTRASGRRTRFNGRRSRLRSQLWRLLWAGASGPWRGESGFRTDERGRALVPGLPKGQAVVDVTSTTHATGHSDPVKLVEGVVAKVQVRLRRGIAVMGRVVDVEGEGIGAAKISLGGGSPATTRSDAEGHFRLVGSAGEASLEVQAPGYPLHTQTVALVPGAASPDLEVVLARDGVVISGWVLNTQGASVTGALVRIRGQGGATVAATTDQRGAFELLAPVKGPHRVTVLHESYAPVTLKGVVAGPDLTITLSPGGSLQVEVLDGDYDPVKGAEVLAVGPVTPSAARVGAGGIVRFERLPVGLYRLDVSAENMVPVSQRDIAVVEDEVTGPIRIVLEDAGSLSGQVLDQDNLGLGGVQVSLVHRVRPALAAKIVTKADGRFRFEALPAGQVTLRATLPGWEEGGGVETIVAGDDYGDVVLYMSPL